ncbi:MAG: DUF2071 domain-containing protein [Bacteroidia bacterium]
MKIPRIEGTIDRRILINFTVDKDVLAKFLPKPFRPILIGDKGLAGICLIRLKYIRPFGFPEIIGIGSENAAHRIAVEWTDNSKVKQGVYIPRRDTNSLLNHWTGGRLFPGIHHLAKFDVDENVDEYKITIVSADENFISISAKQSGSFEHNSIFKNLETASEFYKNGSIGFSPNKSGYDGMELKTIQWHVDPLAVENVKSGFFEDESVFPKGSVTFDNALLMRGIKHEWKNYEPCPET